MDTKSGTKAVGDGPNAMTGVILAGGVGIRFGGDLPKQYLKLAGKPVLQHTIEIFQESADISGIIIVCAKQYWDDAWAMIASGGLTKVKCIVNPGEDRFGSTESALAAMEGYADDSLVLIHDAVRPLLSPDIIHRCAISLRHHQACDVVIPTADTIVKVDSNNCITGIPRRSELRRGQTPQGFRLNVLRRAYQRATETAQRQFTCDCSVVREMLPDTPIHCVAGSEDNLKITTALDMYLAEKIIQIRAIKHESLAPDASNKWRDEMVGKVIVVIGGSSGIGASIVSLAAEMGAKVEVGSRARSSVDVSDPASIRVFLKDVMLRHGQIDAVVNCAGVLIRKPLALMTDDEVKEAITCNLLGALNVARASHESLKSSRGILIFFASSSYTRGRATYSTYTSTKAAVVNLSQALGEEWQPDGIRVVCVSPERTATPMRVRAFGREDPETLLDPGAVAWATLTALTSGLSGVVIDVQRKNSGKIQESR